jgi:alkanesulfonate monooxygenase SsuD/methylene tetrahydromethanopterin reductase-like flavin-dependent oxidoreductase (luciferase family)
MHFGVFDHLDHYDVDLKTYNDDRLALIEAYDRAGFYAYHLAEHHSTPLGMAPSPSVFLSAIAQRTKRLRFGPMVYALPLHQPLRLLEEICMLDHMSGGRMEIGFGRGSSPIELAYYGIDPATAQEIYAEALELILKGFTSEVLTFRGKRFAFENVPMSVRPRQRPHPPVWYGVHAPESAERAARRGLHTINLDPSEDARVATQRYLAVWRQLNGAAPSPKLGLGRFVVVAETDAEALALARRAYLVWHRSFTHLFRLHGRSQAHPRPPDYDVLMERGQGIAGSPETVTRFVEQQLADTGCNYLVGQFAFGDLTPAECEASLGLFVDKVMPALRDAS